MTGTLFIQLVYIYKSIKVKGYSCIVRFIKPHTSCHPLRKSQYCIEMHWPEQYCDVTRAHVFPDTLYSRLPNSGKTAAQVYRRCFNTLWMGFRCLFGFEPNHWYQIRRGNCVYQTKEHVHFCFRFHPCPSTVSINVHKEHFTQIMIKEIYYPRNISKWHCCQID